MVLLGVLTNGKVLLCDSVDRSWYNGGQRLKIIDLSDIMEYMFLVLLFQKVCIITEQAPTAVTSKYTKLVNSFLDFWKIVYKIFLWNAAFFGIFNNLWEDISFHL